MVEHNTTIKSSIPLTNKLKNERLSTSPGLGHR